MSGCHNLLLCIVLEKDPQNKDPPQKTKNKMGRHDKERCRRSR